MANLAIPPHDPARRGPTQGGPLDNLGASLITAKPNLGKTLGGGPVKVGKLFLLCPYNSL